MGFVENVNRAVSIFTDAFVGVVNSVNSNASNINKLVQIHDAGELPLINDLVPSTHDVYSSSKVQAELDAKEIEIANLAGASGSLTSSASLSLTTSFQDLSFTAVIPTTNNMLFTIGNSQFTIVSNGTYNFFSTLNISITTNQTRTITFEVYEPLTNTVYATTTQSINNSNGDIIIASFSLNTLMNITNIAFGTSKILKVRAKLALGNDVTINSFGSTLILSGATSSGGQLLGSSAIKAIQYLAQSTSENLVVPDNTNAFSVGSITFNDGSTLTVPNNSTYKVL